MRAWLAIAALAALLYAATRSQARTINRLAPLIDGASDDNEGEPMSDLPAPYDPGPVYDANDARARSGNVAAFLAAIATFESAPGDEGYAMLFRPPAAWLPLAGWDGATTFADFSDHPGNLGWSGVPLPAEQCQAAGLGPGCKSYAAGRYQITRTTWNRLRRKLGFAELPDFSPASQDRAAIELIDEKLALGLVQGGYFDDAIARVRAVWASMPGANYKQREHDLAAWRQAYANHGGAFA